MTLLIFFIAAFAFSAAIFFIQNRLLTKILLLIFSFMLIGISLFSYSNLNEVDSHYYKFDALSVLLMGVLCLLSLASFYHSHLYLKRKNATKRQEAIYYASMILFITAMVSAYFAENLALYWVSVEATSLFVSFLIYHIREKETLEASWKYLFVSTLSLAIAFIGILFLSIVASENGVNNLNFHNLLSIAKDMNLNWLKIAFVLILTGLSVKLNVFPLYAVAVDAKTIAPTPVNALMSTALVNVGFVGIYRIYTIIAQTEALSWAKNVLMIIAVISIIITTIQLTRVKRFKRLLAFSSMEHIGIILIGMAVGGIGYYAAILHLILHSFVKASLFYQLGAIRQFFKSIWINDAGNYIKLNPTGSIVLLLGLISILAIPPSGLFISEFMVFKALFINGNIAVGIFVLILLTLIIYTVVKMSFHLIYREISDDKINVEIKPNPYENISQFVLLSLAIYLGLNPPDFFIKLITLSIT